MGKLYFSSGCLAYDGNWVDNQFHGYGKLFNDLDALDNAQGQMDSEFDYRDFDKLGDLWFKYEGRFIQDMKAEIGSLCLLNQEKYIGQFANDKIDGYGAYYTKSNKMI